MVLLMTLSSAKNALEWAGTVALTGAEPYTRIVERKNKTCAKDSMKLAIVATDELLKTSSVHASAFLGRFWFMLQLNPHISTVGCLLTCGGSTYMYVESYECMDPSH